MFSPVRFLWFAAVVAALVLAVAVTALELGAIVPGLGLFSAIGSFVIPILGPLLVVAALPAIGLGLWRRRRSPRRTATAAAAAGIAGAVTGIAVIAIMISAVGAAGGSVNIFRALAPSSVAAASPNANAVYDTVDGQALSVAIYRPSGPPRAWPTLFYIHGGGWNGAETTPPRPITGGTPTTAGSSSAPSTGWPQQPITPGIRHPATLPAPWPGPPGTPPGSGST